MIILDNGRSGLLGSEFQDMLRLYQMRRLHEPLPGLSDRRRPCIRHGLCRAHGFGAVAGTERPGGNPASAQCLHLLRALRGGLSDEDPRCPGCCGNGGNWPSRPAHSPAAERYGIAVWAWFAKRPWLYRPASRLAARLLAWTGRRDGVIRKLPLLSGWTDGRDFPAPQGGTFQAQWRKQRGRAGT